MRSLSLAILPLILITTACVWESKQIDTFIMDYPHGEQRIMVKRSGEAYLYFASSPSFKIIRKNTFSVDELYRSFEEHLHPNVPREQWPDPQSQCGMVTLRYADDREEDYLIVDMLEFTTQIFDKAKKNAEGGL